MTNKITLEEFFVGMTNDVNVVRKSNYNSYLYQLARKAAKRKGLNFDVMNDCDLFKNKRSWTALRNKAAALDEEDRKNWMKKHEKEIICAADALKKLGYLTFNPDILFEKAEEFVKENFIEFQDNE